MTKNELIQDLAKVERLAGASRWGRLMHHPLRYLNAILFKEVLYPRSKKERLENARLFWGRRMKVALPSSTDIYLTGGKSHDSELRLARFIVLNLPEKGHFLDIGAHYGYFTLLAAEVAGAEGRVHAFEPAASSWSLLRENVSGTASVMVFNEAVSDAPGKLVFYEFPNLYSEYNTMDVEQFRSEPWFEGFSPRQTEVTATTIDALTAATGLKPDLIKIDVEGAEDKVINGGAAFLQQYNPYLVMEYLEPQRHNDAHKKAAARLRDWGYRSFIITASGALAPVGDIESYLLQSSLESDNIVFRKAG